MKDPIENGNEIFGDILKVYPDHITDIELANNLIQEIIFSTEGWVIVDFLDFGSWDRLTKCYIDKENGLIYLIQEETDKSGITAKLPHGYIDGLVLRFKDLLTYYSDNLSGLFLRGYTLKQNKIRKLFEKGTSNFSFDSKRNFAMSFERTFNNIDESFDVFNSPIYSLAIIPKNSSLGSAESQELLFTINFNECIQRLQIRKLQLEKVDSSDEDSICEKANTGRRIFEFVLKLECCLIEHMVSFSGFENAKSASFKKDYDKLLLGDLKSIIDYFKPVSRQGDLIKIVAISNKLSHDSGEPVNKQEAIELLDIMIDYTKELLELIRDHALTTNHYTGNLKKIVYDSSVLKTIKLSDFKL